MRQLWLATVVSGPMQIGDKYPRSLPLFYMLFSCFYGWLDLNVNYNPEMV